MPAPAFAAPQPPLNLWQLLRPSAALAQQHDLQRIDYHDAVAAGAIHPQTITGTREVVDGIQALRTHGFRLIDQTSFAAAARIAASPMSAAESDVSMSASESVERYMFTFRSQ